MSVQFGRWSFEGEPASPDYFKNAEELLAPYGPDCGSSHSSAGIHILHRAYHTTRESRLEIQPYFAYSGAVITWDGCLDNHRELAMELKDALTSVSTDVAIVAAAYDRWGTGCLGKLIGDWALCIWTPKTRSLILAKDAVGTRHLYYSVDRKRVIWSTVLDPLVLLAAATPALCEEYIAGWFSFFPATHLTPYAGIHSVPPASLVFIQAGRQSVERYWDFASHKRIRYSRDSAYEEHFRSVFSESVRRKLRSDSPVLAELSGGMDSSSIVCIADTLIAQGRCDTPRLDTVSYYDDDEPNWNERPFFTKVEERRGRTGCHINVSSNVQLLSDHEQNFFAATPATGDRYTKANKQLADCLNSQSNRVILSGIGGDEFLGGVPTPVPELANCIARLHVRTLARQLIAWSLPNRRPMLHLLAETLRGFLPMSFAIAPNRLTWLCPDFAKRHRAALRGYETRRKIFGSLPSFQENLATLDLLRRQLSCAGLSSYPIYEKRYPFLDRDVLEFVYAIPREQLARPHRRRSLMRRALVGILPFDLLERRRKAFVARGSILALSAQSHELVEMTRNMVSASLGIVNPAAFASALQEINTSWEFPIVPILRTLRLERWLQQLKGSDLLQPLTDIHCDNGCRKHISGVKLTVGARI